MADSRDGYYFPFTKRRKAAEYDEEIQSTVRTYPMGSSNNRDVDCESICRS
jgi:hypothetical protein